MDEALARVVTTRTTESLADAASHLSPTFIADLDRFFANEATDPSRWLTQAMALGNASLPVASGRAFSETLSLVSIPREQSKVLMEWARREEAAGQTLAAVGHYFAAYRCDPDQMEALDKVKTLGGPIVPRIMLGQWDVFGSLNDEAEFQRILAKAKLSINAGDMLRNNFSRNWFFANSATVAVLGAPLDCSFLVTKGARPVLYVPCTVRGYFDLACYEVPIVLMPTDDAEPDDLPIAYDLALNHLSAVAQYVGADRMNLEEPDLPILTPVSLFAAKRIAVSVHLDRGFIDLTREPAEIWKGVRKGHRHAINWGKKALEIKHWDGVADGPIADLLKLYDRSGRRPSFSHIDEVRPMWSGQRGDLYLAYKDGQLLAMVAINYEGEHAYYTASVSAEHDEVPSTHWPLYNAILRAKERGSRTFHFGYLENDPSLGEKKFAIAKFKRGFTEEFTRHIWWFVSIHGRAPASSGGF